MRASFSLTFTKKPFLVCILYCVLLDSPLAQTNIVRCAKTPVVDGLFVAVAGQSSASGRRTWVTSSVDERVVFNVFKVNEEPVQVSYPIDLRYRCRMELLDAKAKLVRRTKQGKIVGSKFDRLKAFSDCRMNIMPEVQQSHEGRPQFGVGTFVPPPADLFDIKESGPYVLKLEFQIFVLAKKGTNTLGRFIRFPPIALTVDK